MQEYWIGLPLPCSSPGHFPDSEIELASPALEADSSRLNQWEDSFVIIQGKPVEDKPTSWDDDSDRTEALRLCSFYLVSLLEKQLIF